MCFLFFTTDLPTVTTILSAHQQSFLLLQSAEFFNVTDKLAESTTIIRSYVCVVNYDLEYYIDSHNDIHFDCSTRQVSLSDNGDTWIGSVKDNKPYGRGCIVNDSQEISTFLIDGRMNGPTVVKVNGDVTERSCYLKGKKEWVTTMYKPNGESTFEAFFNSKSLASILTATDAVSVNATTGSTFKRETELLCPHPLLFSVTEKVNFSFSVMNSDDFFVLDACLKKLVLEGENLVIESNNMVIQDCPNLESVEAAHGCCNSDKVKQGVVRIHNCPKLSKIIFEENTFVKFSSLLLGGGAVTPTSRLDLPSLKTLTIGSLQSTNRENCFMNAEAFTLSSLPKLKTVTIGNFVFSNVKSFRIGYANVLEKIDYGQDAFRECRRLYVNSEGNEGC